MGIDEFSILLINLEGSVEYPSQRSFSFINNMQSTLVFLFPTPSFHRRASDNVNLLAEYRTVK